MDATLIRGSSALASGAVTRNDLRTNYRRIYRDVYLPRDEVLTAATRAHAAWLSTGATLAGVSAAALLGTKWLDAALPAEIVRADRHSQQGLVAHSYSLGRGEVCMVRGIRLTTPARTAFDIGRTIAAQQCVPILDALFSATGITAEHVLALAERHSGFRGVGQLRDVLTMVDGGSESPQETRLRLLLVGAGLPKPQTQIVFRELRIRVDMGWPQWKVAVGYDGIQHWSDRYQRSWDIERLALLEAGGWAVVRVSAEMLSRPQPIVDRVKTKLREVGCQI
jgi:very-short-patch-repair endonuclease